MEERKEDLIRIILGGVLFVAAVVIDKLGLIGGSYARWILLGIYLVPYVVVGFETITGAFKNIIHGELLDEEFLMTIASIGALVVGEYPEAVAVLLLSAIGEMFEDYAVDRSKDSIAEMMNIAPEFAGIYEDGEIKQVPPEEVKVGDIIVVRPGEKVPLDGEVIEGESMLDTSALTGESVPRRIRTGESIVSGCVNGGGALKVRVSKVYSESTVARILELMQNAEERKAKAEGFVTRFARIYTPIVVAIALLFVIIGPLVFETSFMDSLYKACNFLVISCPCALVISVPLAFFCGLGSASRSGILIKGSNYLEALSKLETVVFDKTGTLTKGEFAVTYVIPANEAGRDEVIKVAAYAESLSTHPIAEAIRREYGKEIDSSRVSDVTELAGHGVSIRLDGETVLAGNGRLMAASGIDIVETDASCGVGTVIYVAKNDKFIGTIVISDIIKEEAAEAIEALKSSGVDKCVMLTGDKIEVAEYVAGKLNIDETRAELLPQDKVNEFESLLTDKHEGRTVAFTGDGINDAPVIARADVGIAMGSLGSDAAIEAADVVLMDDDVRKLAKAVNISKKTMRIAKENIIFAIGVKVIIMVLAAIGFSSMWAAVFADVGVSVLAISNSMRALKK